MRLARGLLERSPEETARRLCLGLLAEAEEALDRLEEGGDEEALHDFRVALRRTRSAIRAYRPFLKGSNPKNLRKRLTALASSTNVARDAEVQIAWLETAGASLPEDASRAAAYLRSELASKEAATPSSARLRKEFDSLRKSMGRAFRRMRLGADVHASFLSATGELLAERGSALQRNLEGIASSGDVDELHRARIEAKRLRYLLEPLRHDVPGARSIVGKMKSLQDCLGELQDARVLTETIATALERAAIETAHRFRERALGREPGHDATDSPTEAGLHRLLEAQQTRRDERFAELSRHWLRKAGRSFFEDVAELAARLAPPTRLRRFLLSSVPESLTRLPPVMIRQGFLPGRNITEHVRSERQGGRTRYFRLVEVAGGTVEEAISRKHFDKLWSLTEGNRLERSRYEIEDDSGKGHVDVVTGSEIVLAELERVPEWLDAFVVRDVTRAKRFRFQALARTRSAPETDSDREASTP